MPGTRSSWPAPASSRAFARDGASEGDPSRGDFAAEVPRLEPGVSDHHAPHHLPRAAQRLPVRLPRRPRISHRSGQTEDVVKTKATAVAASLAVGLAVGQTAQADRRPSPEERRQIAALVDAELRCVKIRISTARAGWGMLYSPGRQGCPGANGYVVTRKRAGEWRIQIQGSGGERCPGGRIPTDVARDFGTAHERADLCSCTIAGWRGSSCRGTTNVTHPEVASGSVRLPLRARTGS